MCGIVGYIGKNEALPFLLSGLEKLEYRGYDSSGVAVCDGNTIAVCRRKGKLTNLKNALMGCSLKGNVGIGHTRWATHGVPSDENAHPHCDSEKKFAVVHNGIIENYIELKNELIEAGYHFASQTDTEVLPNLVKSFYDGCLLTAVSRCLARVQGSYAAAFVCDNETNTLVLARKNSPLIIGIGADGYYAASDIPALIGYVDKYIVLENDDIALVTKDSCVIYHDGAEVKREVTLLDLSVEEAEKGGFDHFMLKEIFEQQEAVSSCLSGRIAPDGEVTLEELSLSSAEFKAINKITMVACGTAYHACLIGKTFFEKILRLTVEVEVASEFRYSDPIIDEHTLTVVVSQSGETADTLAALAEAKGKGSYIIGLTNVWQSSVARESNDVLYNRAGLEIAVASTKAYTTQLVLLYLLGLKLAALQGNHHQEELSAIGRELLVIPDKIGAIISADNGRSQEIGRLIAGHDNAFFIGRGLDYDVAMEGALKLKEISYIHAESYAAGELKHGTLALIIEDLPVISVCTQRAVAEKTYSNIEEVRTRGAKIITVGFKDCLAKASSADEIYVIPDTIDVLAPILTVIPLQLISYYAAVERGFDIDQPRNLAKSVTVE